MPGTGRIVMLAVSAAALVSLTACADMVGNTNREVVSSTQFDNIPCKELISQRNTLVARYGSPDALPEGKKPGERPYLKHEPLGAFLAPDFRSKDQLEARKALGRIDAMNHSLQRRQCEGAPKGRKKPGLG
ncbi:hypothetical protein [Mesorhizobium koreense]|jgi:hypothetical protein|uniref:hypothetical protein n=1 Tax=Mesorhizobium koreense TaxID=3074855 RepID=UPI00287BB447|nr:hypothetical protein [Mesorhizobium sp. WR6]